VARSVNTCWAETRDSGASVNAARSEIFDMGAAFSTVPADQE
jgi:hypothetical protein